MASKSSSRVLTDHDEIQSWAEERGAKPAAVRNTSGDDEPGIIRLDFPVIAAGSRCKQSNGATGSRNSMRTISPW